MTDEDANCEAYQGIVCFARRDLLALEAVIDIAYNARVRPVRASKLAERHGIPRRYLEHALQHLAKEGILKGVRGPRGGYVLARERRRISVGDVLRALREAPKRGMVDNACTAMGSVALEPIWAELAQAVESRLDRICMEQLCRSVQEAGFEPEGGGVQDFTI